MRLSIGKKLGLSIGGLLSLFVLIGVVSYVKARIVQDNVQIYADEKDPLLKSSYLMNIDLFGSSYWLAAYLYDHDGEHLNRMRRFNALFADHLGVYLAHEKNVQGIDWAGKIDRARLELLEVENKIVNTDKYQRQWLAKISQDMTLFENLMEKRLHDVITDDTQYATGLMHNTMAALSKAGGIEGSIGMYLFTHEPRYAQDARKAVVSLMDIVDKLAAAFGRSGFQKVVDDALFIQLKTLAASVNNHMNKIMSMEAVKHELTLALERLVNSTDDMLENQLQINAKQGVDEAMDRIKAASNSAATTVGVTVIIALCFGFAIGIIISLNLSRPIRQLMRATQKVAAGDFSIPVRIRSGDEIGELGQAFSKMADGLGRYITERNKSEVKFRTMLELAVSGIVMIDSRGIIQMANPAAEHMFGYDQSELIGSNVTILMPEPYASRHQQFIDNYIKTGVEKIIGTSRELSGKHRNGSMIPIELSVSEVKLEGERLFLGLLSDISVRKENEQQLKLLANVFNNTIEGIFITDRSGNIKRVNPGFTRITGYRAQDVAGQKPSILKSNRHDKAFYEEMWQSIRQTGAWQGEIWNRKKNGEVFPEWQSITSILNDNFEVTHYVAVFHDISNIKASQEQLQYQANHDALTHLPNRNLFIDRLNQAIATARRSRKRLAVLFLDLDKFKDINDTLGHQVGDKVLQTVAHRLTSCCRDEDTVARLGGDEFMILLPRQSDVHNVAAVARRINKTMIAPMHLNGQVVYPGASVGVSIFPEDGQDASTLMKNSDMAMYRSKSGGRNSYSLFTQSMNEELSRRTALEADLRRAMEKEEFEAYFQPIISTDLLTVLGVEALMRWHRRGEEFVPPNEFIPLAEDFGLIHDMGIWMLEESCNRAKSWHDAGFDQLSLSVNLSRIQFQNKALPDEVARIVHQTGFDPNNLCLEITESMVMREMEKVLPAMDQFRNMGIHLVMDDFGTGYSSLGQLKEFPLRAIKIDKSFIRDCPEDEKSTALVKATVAMGKSLGLTVVAEGVETEAQLAMLREFGCDALQGYLFAKPQPADQLAAMLTQNQGCFSPNGICPRA